MCEERHFIRIRYGGQRNWKPFHTDFVHHVTEQGVHSGVNPPRLASIHLPSGEIIGPKNKFDTRFAGGIALPAHL